MSSRSTEESISRLFELLGQFRKEVVEVAGISQRVTGGSSLVSADLVRLTDDLERTVSRLRSSFRSDQEPDPNELGAAADRVRDGLKRLQGAWDEVNQVLSPHLVGARITQRGRSMDGWLRRWADDGVAAEAVFRSLQETLPPELSWVAQLYYYAGMSQTEIAALLGVSQPTVGAKLGAVDEKVAAGVLIGLVVNGARSEGWDVQLWPSFELERAYLEFDLSIEKDGVQVLILVCVEPGKQAAPGFRTSLTDLHLKGAGLLIFNKVPDRFLALAVYDLSDGFKGLYTPEELTNVQAHVLKREHADLHDFKVVLPQELSPDLALARAKALREGPPRRRGRPGRRTRRGGASDGQTMSR